MNVIVTGSGFIGVNLIKLLLKNGVNVLNIDSFTYAANKVIKILLIMISILSLLKIFVLKIFLKMFLKDLNQLLLCDG